MKSYKLYFTYILLCNDGTYYTGYTTDVDRRVKRHNSGIASKYTRCRRPVKLVYVEKFDDQSSALKREYQIKQLTKTQKCELVLSGRKQFRKILKNNWYKNKT